jgi:hypothetical protein
MKSLDNASSQSVKRLRRLAFGLILFTILAEAYSLFMFAKLLERIELYLSQPASHNTIVLLSDMAKHVYKALLACLLVPLIGGTSILSRLRKLQSPPGKVDAANCE